MHTIKVKRSDYQEIAEQIYSCNGLEIYQVYRQNKVYKLLRATVAVKKEEENNFIFTYSYTHWHNMPSQTSNYSGIEITFPSIAAIYRHKVSKTN